MSELDEILSAPDFTPEEKTQAVGLWRSDMEQSIRSNALNEQEANLAISELDKDIASRFAPQDTGQGLASSAVNAGARGFAGAFTSAVEGAGQMGQLFNRRLNPVTATATLVNELTGRDNSAIESMSAPSKFVEGIGKQATSAVQEALPVNPALQESIPVKAAGVIGQAGGQVLSSIVPGAAFAKAGQAANLARGLALSQGALLGLNAGYQEADRLGITDPKKRDTMASMYAAVEAGTESLGGLGSLAFGKRVLEGAAERGLTQFAKTSLAEGGEEGISGRLQDVASNLFADEDPNNPGFALNGERIPSIDPATKDFWLNTIEDTAYGTLGGTIPGGIELLAASRRNKPASKRINDALSEAPASIPEPVAELEDVAAVNEQANSPAVAAFLRENAQSQAVSQPSLEEEVRSFVNEIQPVETQGNAQEIETDIQPIQGDAVQEDSGGNQESQLDGSGGQLVADGLRDSESWLNEQPEDIRRSIENEALDLADDPQVLALVDAQDFDGADALMDQKREQIIRNRMTSTISDASSTITEPSSTINESVEETIETSPTPPQSPQKSKISYIQDAVDAYDFNSETRLDQSPLREQNEAWMSDKPEPVRKLIEDLAYQLDKQNPRYIGNRLSKYDLSNTFIAAAIDAYEQNPFLFQKETIQPEITDGNQTVPGNELGRVEEVLPSDAGAIAPAEQVALDTVPSEGTVPSFEPSLRSEIATLPAVAQAKWSDDVVQEAIRWQADQSSDTTLNSIQQKLVERVSNAVRTPEQLAAQDAQDKAELLRIARKEREDRKFDATTTDPVRAKRIQDDIDALEAENRVDDNAEDTIRYSRQRNIPAKVVTQEHVDAAINRFKSTDIGKRMLSNLLFAPNPRAALNLPEFKNRKFSRRSLRSILEANGFFDPQTSKSVVLVDEIVPLKGETPEDAVFRVALHEQFHGGLQWMMAKDSKFRNQVIRLTSQLQKQGWGEIAERYPELLDDPMAMFQEWMIARLEKGDPVELAKIDPLWKQFWDALKDLVRRIVGTDIPDKELDRMARSLASKMLNQPDAFSGLEDDEGDVSTSEPALSKNRLEESDFQRFQSDEEREAAAQALADELNVSRDDIMLMQRMGLVEAGNPSVINRVKPMVVYARKLLGQSGNLQSEMKVSDENTRKAWEMTQIYGNPTFQAELIADMSRMISDAQGKPHNAAGAVEAMNHVLMKYAKAVAEKTQNESLFLHVNNNWDNTGIRESAQALNTRSWISQQDPMSRTTKLVQQAKEETTSTKITSKKNQATLKEKAKGDAESLDEAVKDDSKVKVADDDLDSVGIKTKYKPLPVDRKKAVDSLLAKPEESFRTQLEKDGAQRIASLFFVGEKKPSGTGVLVQSSDDLNAELGGMIRDSLKELGIESKSKPEKEDLYRKLVATIQDDLREGKMNRIDEAVREKINEWDASPEWKADMIAQWETVSGMMGNRDASEATARKILSQVLSEKNLSPDSVARMKFDDRQKAVASIRAQVRKSLNESIAKSSSGEQVNTDQRYDDVADYIASLFENDVNSRLAAIPTEDANRIIDQIDKANSEWVGPEKQRNKIQELKKEALTSELTDTSRPGHLTQEGFIQRYAKGFSDLGVDPNVATNLAQRLYDENRKLRTNKENRERDRKAKRVSVKAIAKDIMETAGYALHDPAMTAEKIQQYLTKSGFSEQEASRFASKYAPLIREKILQAREIAFQKAVKDLDLKGIEKGTIDSIRKAIRTGVLDPSDAVAKGLAEQAGFKDITPEQYAKMAALDAQMDKGGVLERAKLHKEMVEIVAQSMPDLTWKKRLARSYTNSVLSGIGTLAIQFTTPVFSGMTRIGTEIGTILADAATGKISRADVPAQISQTLVNAVDSVKGFAGDFGYALKSGVTSSSTEHTHLDEGNLKEDLRRSREMMKSSDPATKLKGLSRFLFASTDYTHRVMLAADEAMTNTMKRFFARQGVLRLAGLKDVPGLTTEEAKGLIAKSVAYAQQKAQEAARNGSSPLEAGAIGRDEMNAYLENAVSDIFGEESGAELRRQYTSEAQMEIGTRAQEEGAGWDVPNLISQIMVNASNFAREKDPLLGRILTGFVTVPVNMANRSLAFTPVGLMRAYAKTREKRSGVDPKLYEQTIGTDLQLRQRYVEGVAGTVGMLIAAALAGMDDDDDYDKHTGFHFTGYGPKDRNLRDAWLKAGNRPYTIEWMDKGKVKAAISYARGGPEILKLPAAAVGALDDMRLNGQLEDKNVVENFGNWTTGALGAGLKATNFFGLKNLTNIVGISDQSDRSAAGSLTWMATGIVPWSGFTKSLTRLVQGPLDNSSVKASIIANLPLVSLAGEPALNFLGDEKGFQPLDLFTKTSDKANYTGFPIYVAGKGRSVNQPLYEFMLETGATPSMPLRSTLESKNGFMTDRRWAQYIKTRGQFIKDSMYAQLPKLRAMSTDERDKAISGISSAATSAAKKKLGLE